MHVTGYKTIPVKQMFFLVSIFIHWQRPLASVERLFVDSQTQQKLLAFPRTYVTRYLGLNSSSQRSAGKGCCVSQWGKGLRELRWTRWRAVLCVEQKHCCRGDFVDQSHSRLSSIQWGHGRQADRKKDKNKRYVWEMFTQCLIEHCHMRETDIEKGLAA